MRSLCLIQYLSWTIRKCVNFETPPSSIHWQLPELGANNSFKPKPLRGSA